MRTLLLCYCLMVGPALADVQVKRFSTTEVDWSANAYWLANERQVLLVDSLLRRSDALNFAAVIKTQNKQVVGLLLTHPHPDHYMGILALKSVLGDFPVYATAATAAGISKDFEQFKRQGARQFGNDLWLDNAPQVQVILPSPGQGLIGDFSILVEDFSGGESVNASVFYHADSRSLFVGDLLMAHHHYYVGDGDLPRILAQFERLQASYTGKADHLYGGHGDSGGFQLIEEQRRYLLDLSQLVDEQLSDANISQPQMRVQQIIQSMLIKYAHLGHYGYPPGTILQWNLQAIQKHRHP